MEFSFETKYNAKTMTLMAKALRKTVRKKHSRRSHICGWVVVVLCLLLAASNPTVNLRAIVTLAVALMIVITLLFEDRINGYFAKKRLLPGTESDTSVFSADGFSSTTAVGKTQWNYENIIMIAESADFFVFIFSANHAQLHDKRHMHGGTAEDFRNFIEAATGKTVQPFR